MKTDPSLDAVELLTSQHREVEQLWQQCRAATSDDMRQDLVQGIIRMLSQHDALETTLLYPAVRTADGGDQLAEHSLEEHQQIRELLKKADGGDHGSLEAAMRMVEHHVHQEEEPKIFPLLRERMDGEQLMDLRRRMERQMKTAPTHPHPTTPNNPLAAKVTGAVAGMADRARDALRRDP
jgi:hemerythrin superfamily protein